MVMAMSRGHISDRLKWILATAITLASIGCVERQSVNMNAQAPGSAGGGAHLTPERGTTVVGTSTGGGWTLRAQPTSALVHGQSVGPGLRLSATGGKAP